MRSGTELATTSLVWSRWKKTMFCGGGCISGGGVGCPGDDDGRQVELEYHLNDVSLNPVRPKLVSSRVYVSVTALYRYSY